MTFEELWVKTPGLWSLHRFCKRVCAKGEKLEWYWSYVVKRDLEKIIFDPIEYQIAAKALRDALEKG